MLKALITASLSFIVSVVAMAQVHVGILNVTAPSPVKPRAKVSFGFNALVTGGSGTFSFKVYQSYSQFTDVIPPADAMLIGTAEVLLETGNTWVFDSIAFEPLPYTFDANQVLTVVSDTNDGSPADNFMFTNVLLNPLTDMHVGELQALSPARAGDPIDFSFNVMLGSGVQTTSYSGDRYFRSRLYLSEDDVFSSGDIIISEHSWNLDAYNEPLTLTKTSNLVIPRESRTGQWFLILVGDPLMQYVREDRYDNNTTTTAIEVLPPLYPDLKISSTGPSSADAGGPATFNVVFTNEGEVPIGHSHVDYEIVLSKDDTLDTDDVVLARTFAEIYISPATGTGTYQTTLTLPEGTAPGAWNIILRGDSEFELEESDENNLYVLPINITAPKSKDLVITNAFLGYGSPDAVQEITKLTSAAASVTIKNNGTGAVGAFHYSLYLSKDNLYGSDDYEITTQVISSLSVGGTTTLNLYFTIPDFIDAGAYYLIAIADSRLHVAEEPDKESNNFFPFAVTVHELPRADLLVVPASGVADPVPASAGFPLFLDYELENAGTTWSNTFSMKYYLSMDAEIDSDDRELMPVGGLGILMDPLDIGQARLVENLQFNIHTTFPAGNYKLIIQVDEQNSVDESNENNNLYLVDVTINVPDLAFANALADPVNVPAGGSLVIKSQVKNLSQVSKANSAFIRYYLSKDDSLDANDMLLGDVGSHTSLLDPSATSTLITSPNLYIPGWLPSASYKVIAKVDADNWLAETDETNNTIAVDINIQYPDLLLVDESVSPFRLAAGATTTVSLAAKNAGAAATWGSYISYFFSEDQVYDPNDISLGEVYVGSIAAGATTPEIEFNATLPVVGAGDYFILAMIDPYLSIAETNETNNTAVLEIAITNPDLVVFSIEPTPTVVGISQELNLKIYVANEGEAKSGQSYISIYLSQNDSIDASDYYYYSWTPVPPLEPSATSAAIEHKFFIPATVAEGPWNIIVVADVGNYVLESDEQNNIGIQPIIISVPDLVVANQLASPSTTSVGSEVRVDADIKNIGEVPSPGGEVRYYLSADATLSPEDYYLYTEDGSFPSLREPNNEDPASSFAATQSYMIIPGNITAGNYFILVQVDPNNNISEANEANNVQAIPITVTIPDLTVVVAESLNATVGSGSEFILRHRISNLSPTAMAPMTMSGFYLSQDNQFVPVDSLLGYMAVPAILQSSNSEILQTPVVMPDTVEAGTYTIFVKSDYHDQLSETDETNNVRSFTINVVNPDLTISNFIPGVQVLGAGQGIAFSVDVDNIGTVPASASVLSLYLSKTEALSDSLYITSVAVPSIAAGERFSVEALSLFIPTTIEAGTWYLIAVADSDDRLAETDELNNDAATPIEIKLPDLSFAAVSISDPTPGVGGTATVAFRVKNEGLVESPFSKLNVYLSVDDVYDQNDIFVGDTIIAPIVPGTVSEPFTRQVTLPYPLEERSYKLIAVADPDSVLSEQDELNNTKSVTATIVWPDLFIGSLSSNNPFVQSTGGTLNIDFEVINAPDIGRAPLSALSFYFSKDSIVDIKDVAVGQLGIPALESGEGHQQFNSWLYLPEMELGRWYLIGVADKQKAIPEKDETNNEFVMPFDVVGPDLFIDHVLLTPTHFDRDSLNTEIAWRTFTTRAVVSNKEFAMASASQFAIYLSEDSVRNSGDQELLSYNLWWISNGESSTVSSTLYLPANIDPGHYYLLYIADVNNTVEEYDELNNIRAVPIEVRHRKPDLVVQNMSLAPALISAGLRTSVGFRISNIGDVKSAETAVHFYLSGDAAIGTDDVFLGSRTVASLSRHDVTVYADSVGIPAGTAPGDYHLLVFADAANFIDEKTESNVAYRSLTVRDPLAKDLQITFTSTLPQVIHAGSELLISALVENNEDGKTAPSVLGYYLSSDDLVSAEDLLLRSTHLPGITAVERVPALESIIIPKDVTPGDYKLLLFVDAAAEITETVETNNVNVIPLEIKELLLADLRVDQMFVMSEIYGNSSSIVYTAVSNIANGRADSTWVDYFLSRNSTLGQEDIPIGGQLVVSVDKYSTFGVQPSLFFPDSTANSYWYLIAKADAHNDVAESSESNNAMSKLVYVNASRYPDLIATYDLVGNFNSTPGGTIYPYMLIRNNGLVDVPETQLRFYISSNAAFDSNDLPLDEVSLTGLYAGIYYGYGYAVTIPQDMLPGSYYLIAALDPDDTILESNNGNNIAIGMVSLSPPPKPDLIVTLVENVSQVAANTFLAFDSHISNEGLGTARPSVTRYYLSTNLVVDEADRLLGVDTVASIGPDAEQVRSKALLIPHDVAQGVYYLLAAIDEEDMVIETDDGNNGDYFEIFVGEELLGDLTATLTGFPASSYGNGVIQLMQTVRNVEAGATGSTTARIYLSKNQSVDGSDILLKTIATPVLAKDSAHITQETLLIPATVVPGDYYLILVADAEDVAEELNESNNLDVEFINIGPAKLPDLAVIDIRPENESVHAGKSLDIVFSVANLSTGGAQGSNVNVYLSSDNNKGAGDLLLAAIPTMVLGPETFYDDTFTAAIPIATTPGNYFIIFVVDETAQIQEDDDSNNTSTAEIIVDAPAYPDLSINSFTLTPASVNAGLPADVTLSILNNGDDASVTTTAGIFLSTNNSLDASDPRLDTITVSPIGVGAVLQRTKGVRIPANIAPGSYFLFAKADVFATQTEKSESNNVAVATLTVLEPVYPDLVVTNGFANPSSIHAGLNASISFNVKNQGLTDAAGNESAIYVSADQDLDANDVLLKTHTISHLSANENTIAGVEVSLPNTLEPGSWHILIKADHNSQVQESDDGNNVFAFQIQVLDPLYPDLIISTMSALPASVPAGQPLTAFVTTKNTGDAPSDNSTTRVYLSSDEVVDSNDVSLISIEVNDLAINAAAIASRILTIPVETFPGEYFVIAVADVAAAVQETSEENNANAVTITVLEKFKPDLALDGTIVADASVHAGQDFEVSYRILNKGKAAAVASVSKLYLSVDGVIDNNDILLDERNISALSVNQGVLHSFNTPVALATIPGNFTLLLSIDASQLADESDESNNVAQTGLVVNEPLPADLVTSTPVVTPNEIMAGETIDVTSEIGNVSANSALPGKYTILLSGNQTADANDLVLKSGDIASLVANASITVTGSFTIDEETEAGTYYVIVVADSDGDINETSETNNAAFAAIEIAPYVGVEQPADPGIGIYPNPVRDQLLIGWEGAAQIEQVSISDISGKNIFEHEVIPGQTSIQVDVDGWNAGMYMVQLKANNRVHVRKVFKK